MPSEPSPQGTEENAMGYLSAIKFLSTQYGPQTFGIAVLITMQICFVNPQLDRAAKNEEAWRSATQNQEANISKVQEIVQSLHRQVETLDRVVIRTERQ